MISKTISYFFLPFMQLTIARAGAEESGLREHTRLTGRGGALLWRIELVQWLALELQLRLTCFGLRAAASPLALRALTCSIASLLQLSSIKWAWRNSPFSYAVRGQGPQVGLAFSTLLAKRPGMLG